MTWLTPLTGLIVAAIVVPPLLALYFLRLRRSPREVSSTLLWKRSVEDLRANAPFQRLRASALLFLQLLVLALLAFALMQPQIEGLGRRGRRTVIAIDQSASMNVKDADGRSRLERAKEEAIRRVETLHGGGLFAGGTGEIMVVAFADGASVRTPFTESKSQAIDAITAIEATDERTRFAEALELARAFTESIEAGRENIEYSEPAVLEIFSDGRISGIGDLVLRAGEDVAFTLVAGDAADNVAVSSVAAEREWDDPTRVQVFAALANHGPEAVEVDVQLLLDGRIRAVTPRPVEVPAGGDSEELGRFEPGRERVVFVPFELESGATVEVRIMQPDSQPGDDVAAIAVAPPRRLRVAFIGNVDSVVASLLAVMPLESLDVISPAELDALRAEPDGAEGWDVVVVHGAAVGALPTGRFLLLGATPELPGLESFGDAENVLVRTAREEHPALRFSDLGRLLVRTARKVQLGDGFRVLADGSGGPLLAEYARGRTRAIVSFFDPLDSLWPTQRSFANFIPSAVEYLATSGLAIGRDSLEPGEVITARVPSGAREIEIVTPVGRAIPVAARAGGDIAWGPARRAGVYEVRWRDADGAASANRIAVNMPDSDEGRIARQESLRFARTEVTGEAGEGVFRRNLWPWALGAVLVLLVAEWWVWARRSA